MAAAVQNKGNSYSAASWCLQVLLQDLVNSPQYQDHSNLKYKTRNFVIKNNV
jgi:hypothetical protein